MGKVCGACQVFGGLLAILIGGIAYLDYQKFDPFYTPMECSPLYLAMPVWNVAGFESVPTGKPWPNHKTLAPSVTVALDATTGTLVEGAANPEVMQFFQTAVAIQKAQVINNGTAITPELASIVGGVPDNASNAQRITAMETYLGGIIAGFDSATQTAVATTMATQAEPQPSMHVDEVTYMKSAHVPLSIQCKNKNAFDVTLHAAGTEGMVFMYNQLADDFKPIGSVKALNEAKLTQNKLVTISLGLKLRLTGTDAGAFLTALNTGPKAGPLFFNLNPLRTTSKSTCMGITVEERDPVLPQYCGVLVAIRVEAVGPMPMQPWLQVISPTYCRHSWAALKPLLLTPAKIGKYAAHKNPNPLPDVPTAPNQRDKGFLDEFAPDPKRLDDNEKLLQLYYSILMYGVPGFGLILICCGVASMLEASPVKAAAAPAVQVFEFITGPSSTPQAVPMPPQVVAPQVVAPPQMVVPPQVVAAPSPVVAGNGVQVQQVVEIPKAVRGQEV